MRHRLTRLTLGGLLAALLVFGLTIGVQRVLADSLATTISVSVKPTLTGGSALAPTNASIASAYTNSIVNGTATGQADKVYAATLTIAASGTNSLDLAGSLTDPLGTTVTFVKVKAIYVKASSANTNNVVIGGAGANAFIGPFNASTDKVSVAPGDVFIITKTGAGWTVTPSTADLFLTANSGAGTGVTFEIVIVGTSA